MNTSKKNKATCVNILMLRILKEEDYSRAVVLFCLDKNKSVFRNSADAPPPQPPQFRSSVAFFVMCVLQEVKKHISAIGSCAHTRLFRIEDEVKWTSARLL